MIKKTTIGFCLTLAVLTACDPKDVVNADGNSLDAETSYAFGMLMGSDLKPFGFKFDYKAFMEGFKAYFDEKANITEEEAILMVQQTISSSMQRAAEKNLADSVLFLEENALKNGIITTESGLQYEIIEETEGAKPKSDDTVRVNYEGTLIDGKVFDSSFERGEPVEFPLGQVIPGWTEGIQLMSPGSRYKFYIPPELGYGDQPVGNGLIPANSVLIFDVELLDIVN
ncbi:MAG: FKBP-type peptidyl-prolyl cis-trans isomerase [Spirochaetaceae bacterium]|jgi:FKBP-type peptidyl-prolyl cis-trans isomerase FkpA|nr:FKBP-type peptidyl-prolyl cis-trans isomerase [Spirochaetaceae bacterium]